MRSKRSGVRPETSYELECLIIYRFVGILRNCNITNYGMSYSMELTNGLSMM